MTQGFYEQLGVDPAASAADVRAAYGRVIAQLSRRRKAIVEQGGDPSLLDVARSQADEAWSVLQDPARRRKYDAMRALMHDGWSTDPNEVWRRASGALVHPAAGAAAELLRVVTTLKVGALPPVPQAPGAKGKRNAEDEKTVTQTAPTAVPRATATNLRRVPPPVEPEEEEYEDDELVEVSDRVVPMPGRAESPPTAGLKVVNGSPSAAPVVVMPSTPRKKTLSAEDLVRLLDRHGWGGAYLAAVRAAKGLSVQEMSDTTRISVKYLEAIEGDRHDSLPSSTFVRGYVREMARMLGLDEEAAVAGYMRKLQ
jgi:hypothetical protein